MKNDELTIILDKVSSDIMTLEEEEYFRNTIEWTEMYNEWELMSGSSATELKHWIECVRNHISKENYDLLFNVFRRLFPLQFGFYDGYRNSETERLKLDGFLLEKDAIDYIIYAIEIILNDNNIISIMKGHNIGNCDSVVEWDHVKYNLNSIFDFTLECYDSDVAIIYRL